MRLRDGVRAAALFEAAKGLVVLIAGFGLLAVVHRDAQQLAESLVAHLHLNPASHYPRIFLDAAASVTPGKIGLLSLAQPPTWRCGWSRPGVFGMPVRGRNGSPP